MKYQDMTPEHQAADRFRSGVQLADMLNGASGELTRVVIQDYYTGKEAGLMEWWMADGVLHISTLSAAPVSDAIPAADAAPKSGLATE